MKKWYVFVSLLILAMLVACSAGGETSGTATQTAVLQENYDDALSAAGQLALGSLKLEDTELALTVSQAETLLPFWQAYQTLGASDTASDVEINAVLKQIQNTLGAEQLSTIADMQLTSEDVTTWMQESGVSMGRMGRSDDGEDSGTTGFGGFGGGMPGGGGMLGGGGGGMPAGGMEMGGAGMFTGEGDSEMPEIDAEEMMAAMSEQVVINAVIRQLQTKTGVEVEDPMQGGRAMMEEMMVAFAEVLDVPAETLQSEMAEGNSLSQVITSHGGDVEQVTEEIKSILAESTTFEGQDLDQLLSSWLQSGQ